MTVRPRRRRLLGITFSEVILSIFLTSMVLAVAYQFFTTLIVGQFTSVDEGQVAAQSRQAISAMSDHLRNASSCDGSNGVAQSVLDSASTTSFTYYSTTTCTKVTYTLSGTKLTRQVGTGTATTAASNVTSLNFTYYKAATYNTPWSTTADPHNPTSAELPFVCGIQMNVTCTYQNAVIKSQTIVRMRNAPAKSNVSGL